ncbi:hypothetical protein VPHD260_0129 [Vibrio phage D260]
MSNLHINIRFGTWFFQVTRQWKLDCGHSQYWILRKKEKGTLKGEWFKVIQVFNWHF